MKREFDEELERLKNVFDPARWSGQREEIEFAFGDIENRVIEYHRVQLQSFVAGFDQRELHARTSHQIERLTEHMHTLPMDQQWGSQEAINDVIRSAKSEMVKDSAYQELRSSAQSGYGYKQAEELQNIYDAEFSCLEKNGFENEITNTRGAENKDDRSDVLIRMYEILSETREDIERIDQMANLAKPESTEATRRNAFIANMNKIDRDAELEQGRGY